MSSQKTGRISGLKVVSSDEVWKRRKNGQYYLDRSKYEIFGKVIKGCGFVTEARNPDSNEVFKEDFINLSKATKTAISTHLFKTNNGKTNKRKVCYLVKNKK
ncbi:MAG: hypothetical protein ACI4MT_04640 [Christensenellales bacterium]